LIKRRLHARRLAGRNISHGAQGGESEGGLIEDENRPRPISKNIRSLCVPQIGRRGSQTLFTAGGNGAAFPVTVVTIPMTVAIPVPIDTVFIFADSLAQRVAVDAQFVRRLGQIVMMTVDNLQNKFLFEFFNGFIKENAASNHLINQGFQFSFHGIFLTINAALPRRRQSDAFDG
jgi:hypothetical protein